MPASGGHMHGRRFRQDSPSSVVLPCLNVLLLLMLLLLLLLLLMDAAAAADADAADADAVAVTHF